MATLVGELYFHVAHEATHNLLTMTLSQAIVVLLALFTQFYSITNAASYRGRSKYDDDDDDVLESNIAGINLIPSIPILNTAPVQTAAAPFVSVPPVSTLLSKYQTSLSKALRTLANTGGRLVNGITINGQPIAGTTGVTLNGALVQPAIQTATISPLAQQVQLPVVQQPVVLQPQVQPSLQLRPINIQGGQLSQQQQLQLQQLQQLQQQQQQLTAQQLQLLQLQQLQQQQQQQQLAAQQQLAQLTTGAIQTPFVNQFGSLVQPQLRGALVVGNAGIGRFAGPRRLIVRRIPF